MDSTELHALRPAPHAFILIGPTASGKSAVAQLLAEQTGAPVVSADSMNIYRGMNVGTAKPSAEDRRVVDYHGIDLVDPTERFSVGDWLNAVRPVFQTWEPGAAERGKTPIVAGGTGLYVKCLQAGLDDLPPADDALRARVEKMTLAQLQAEARETSPAAYEALADKENPRRLIRLLEKSQDLKKYHTCAGVILSIGSGPNGQKGEREACRSIKMPVIVGLHVERNVLCNRIADRVDQMYTSGLIEEARGLMGLELSSTAQHAIGYAEAFAVLRGEMSEADAKEKTVIRTRQLAKRQMTWFRNQLNVEWIDTAAFPTIGKLAEKISNGWKPVPVSV